MQSRAARLILLGLFLIAISTAAFLFWRGDTEASNAALQAKTFDATAKTIERSVARFARGAARLCRRQSARRPLGWQGGARPRDRADGYPGAPRGNHRARSADRARRRNGRRSMISRKADKRAAEYIKNEQRLLASDVVFGDGLEQSRGGPRRRSNRRGWPRSRRVRASCPSSGAAGFCPDGRRRRGGAGGVVARAGGPGCAGNRTGSAHQVHGAGQARARDSREYPSGRCARGYCRRRGGEPAPPRERAGTDAGLSCRA